MGLKKSNRVAMRYSARQLFQDRKETFSAFWLEIFGTRFFLCVIVTVFVLVNTQIRPARTVFLSVLFYFTFNMMLGLVHGDTLRLKKMRIVPEVADIIFISQIIHFGGGPQSSWFLFYVFPIMSASRYLGVSGCAVFAILSTIAYTFLSYYAGSNTLDVFSFSLRVLVLGGVAVTAGSLARMKNQEEERLTKVFEEIDEAILSNVGIDKVLSLILNKAIEFSGSDMGQMMFFANERGTPNLITAPGNSERYKWGINPLTKSFFQELVDSRKHFIIATLRRSRLRSVLGTSFDTHWPAPKSALFVPLHFKDTIIGMTAVYSRKRLHYTKREAKRLMGFAPLVAIAQKNADLYKEIASAAKESKDRLTMLYKIGERLKSEQGLQDLFTQVVDLIYNQLDSEEAALFIPHNIDQDEIKKVAVKGPTYEITNALNQVERTYRSGESLAGSIYASREYYYSNDVPTAVKYVKDYSEILPSGKISHYIGVPLVIGDEVLGVIRVINKRSKKYSLKDRPSALSNKGFNDDDVELMQTIATQVASAIRNAGFIEAHKYFQTLVASSPDPIVVLDEQGKISVFNTACEELLGLSSDEVRGKRVEVYYESSEEARKIGKQLWESMSYSIRDYETRIRHISGELIPISLSARLLFAKAGAYGSTKDVKDGDSVRRHRGKKRKNNREGQLLIGSIGVFKDLRELKRLQQDEQLKAVGRLTHKVGHDIKHDIASIRNYVDTLASETRSEPELSAYADIKAALSHALEKLQNMLTATSPKASEMVAVTVEELFQDLEETIIRTAADQQVAVSICLPKDQQWLLVDPDQMRQVLSNLLSNSLDAIKEKEALAHLDGEGRVELLAQINDGWLEIMWKDNGCGVPSRNLHRLFSPFFTSKQTGNGLGLFIMKSIIEGHGGHVVVQSEEGAGTTIKISLPVLEQSARLGELV